MYNCIKIIHILLAASLLVSFMLSIREWLRMPYGLDAKTLITRIQTQTTFIIIPILCIQLILGFTIISLKQYPMMSHWILGSVMSFLVLIASWLMFNFSLLSKEPQQQRFIQLLLLALSANAFLSMIFFMANRIE